MERNKSFLAGNVGNDPKVTEFESGKAVATFSIAESTHQKDVDGKRPVVWHSIECWNSNIVKNITNFLKKGDNVDIEGYIKYKNWEDNDGVKRTSTIIVATEVNRLNRREK